MAQYERRGRLADAVQTAVRPAQVITWLRERGFRLSGVHHMAYDAKGLALQGDFLFANKG